MKIFHTGDVHLGKKNLNWTRKALLFAVEDAIERNCDVAIVAGDLYDHALGVHEPAVIECVNLIAMLAEEMPVLITYGTASHDRSGSLDILTEINSRFPIYISYKPESLLLSDNEWFSLGNVVTLGNDDYLNKGDAVFFTLPGINKADPAIMKFGAQTYVENKMNEFAQLSHEINHSVPCVLVAHGTVVGCITESRFAMISPDHEFTEDILFSSGADAIMLAHIHAHQSWSQGEVNGLLQDYDWEQTIAYCGSLARLVHGDHAPKGFLIWDVEPGKPSFEFVETPTRQLLEIEFDGPPDMNDLQEIAQQAGPDDAVRIRWNIDEEYAAEVDKEAIRALFEDADTCKLEPSVNPIYSVRAKDINMGRTLEDKVSKWLETSGDTSKTEHLIDRLQQLKSMDPDVVVETTIVRANDNCAH